VTGIAAKGVRLHLAELPSRKASAAPAREDHGGTPTPVRRTSRARGALSRPERVRSCVRAPLRRVEGGARPILPCSVSSGRVPHRRSIPMQRSPVRERSPPEDSSAVSDGCAARYRVRGMLRPSGLADPSCFTDRTLGRCHSSGSARRRGDSTAWSAQAGRTGRSASRYTGRLDAALPASLPKRSRTLGHLAAPPGGRRRGGLAPAPRLACHPRA